MPNKTFNQYLRSITPYTTIAGCVRLFENVWNDGDKTIEFLNKESTDDNLPIYWVKKEPLNYLELKDNYKNYGNSTFTHFYNDISYIVYSSLDQYTLEYDIKDDINISNIQLVKIKPNIFIDNYKSDGKLSAFIFLNKESETSLISFSNFGLKLNPSHLGMMLVPNSFPYKLSIRTEDGPLYFFHASV